MHGYRVVPRFRLRGFPQVPIKFVVGNLPELSSRPMFEVYNEWKQTYGRTFLVFAGSNAMLVTSGEGPEDQEGVCG